MIGPHSRGQHPFISRVLSPLVEGSLLALLTCLQQLSSHPQPIRLPYSIRKYITVQLGVQVYLSIQVYSALCWIFVCFYINSANYNTTVNLFYCSSMSISTYLFIYIFAYISSHLLISTLHSCRKRQVISDYVACAQPPAKRAAAAEQFAPQ